ncbi:hypothetical protein BDB01DRAFT_830691 [Pilobolus umbonatus]|nr:hypothetical protein BDB01DRAFT_830691 [Pilobolus umbonatus]
MLKVDRQYKESLMEVDILKEWNDDYLYSYALDSAISSSWSIISPNKHLDNENSNDNYELVSSLDERWCTASPIHTPSIHHFKQTLTRLFPSNEHSIPPLSTDVLPRIDNTQKSVSANTHQNTKIEDSLLVVMIDKSSINRYEALFDSIQDNDYVDGITVRTIWSRSHLPKQILCQIWADCDPMKQGSLDRNGFIKGMGHIDTLLAKQNKYK